MHSTQRTMNERWIGAIIRCIPVAFFISILVIGSACSRAIEWSSPVRFSISGKVQSLLVQSQMSSGGNNSSLSCTSATASLFKLNPDGSRITPAIEQTAIASDGSYTFEDVRSRGVQTSSISNSLVGGYLVEVTGCSKAYSRILTGFDTQDVTVGSTLVSSIAQTSQAANVVNADKTQVASLISSLNNFADYDSAYSALVSDATLNTKFTTVFNVSPSTLVNAAPTLVSASVPQVANEHDLLGLNFVGSQWNSNYSYAYLWEFDGAVISTVAAPSYRLSGNSQGSHVISVFYGQADANGNLDQTKPFGSKSYAISIANTVLPVPPSVTVIGSSNINTPAVPISIATGVGFVGCDTFSSIAITEDDLVPPLSSATFGISCTQSPTQNYTYTLQGGIGSHTLRFWSKDASGVVSLASQSLAVNYSIVVPSIHITSPNSSGPFKPNLTISGDCDISAGDVQIVGDIAAPLVTSCNSGLFSQSLVLAGADGSKALTAKQINSFGTTGQSSVNVTLDSTPPTLVLATNVADPTNASSYSVSATFSESVTGFTQSQVSVGNGSISNFSGSGANYSFTVSPSAQGVVTVNVAAGSALDAAGNLSSAATTLSRTFDTVQSSVSIASTASSPTNLSVVPVTLQFSKPVSGLTLAGLTLVNATASGFAGSGTTYSVNLAPASQGSFSMMVAPGAAHDQAGNLSLASAVLSRVFDSVQPSVTLSSTVGPTTNLASIPVTVVFSKAVTGLSASSFTLSNATISGFSGSGANYSFNLLPIGQGVVSASLNAGNAHDSAGNASTVSNILTRTFDSVQPTVTVTTTTSSPTNLAAIPVSIQFSKSVTGLSLSSFSVSNGSVSGLSGSGQNYTLSLMPTAQGSVSLNVKSATATDVAGNGNSVSNTLSLYYDTVQPAVTLATTASSPTNSTAIPVTVTFTKSVSGLSASSFSLTNSTLNSFSGSGTTYSFMLTPNGQGAVNVSLAAGKVSDSAGNTNTSSNSLGVTYDSVLPVVTLSTNVASPTSQSAINVSLSSTKSVSGLSLSQFSVTNGSVSSLSGSGTSYSLTLTPASVGAVGLKLNAGSVTDSAGNQNADSNSINLDYNNIKPSVTLATTQSSPTNASAIAVTVHFSASVTGFSSSNLTLSNASISGFSGSGADYAFSLSPSGQGSFSVSIASGVAQDSAANLNTASNVLSLVYDTVAPTAILSSATGSTLNSSPIPVTLVFSKAVTGFSLSKLNLTNGSASGLTGSGTTYSFNVTPSAQGTVAVSVQAGGGTDSAGNLSLASASLSRTYDTVPASVTLTSTTTSPTNANTIPLTVTFSKAVSGLALSSFTVSNGTLSTLTGTGTTYNLSLVPSSQGAVSVLLNSGAATDQAGNGSAASNSFSINYDTTQPTVLLSTTSPSPTNSASLAMSLAFSKPISGLALSGISVSNGVASGLTGSAANYTFSVAPSGQGVVSVQISASQATDAAGNSNVASNIVSVTYDSVLPVLTISSPASGSYVNLANQSSIAVSGTCSKAGTVNLAVSNLTLNSSCLSGSFSATIDLHTLADGALTLTANQTDAAGNQAVQKSVSVTKDTSVPTAAIANAPTSPSRTTTLNVTVNGTSVSHYLFKVGAASSLDCTSSSGYSAEAAVATHITSDISSISDSAIKLCVVGRNLAGNYQSFSSSTSTTWLKDTVVTPFSNLGITPSSPGKNTKPQMSGTTEAQAVVQMFSLPSCAGSVLAGTTAAADGTFALAASSSIGSDGNYNFSLLATDIAGNTLCSSPSTGYTLDTIAPTLTLSTTAPGSTNTSPIPVTAAFSESITGLSAASFTAVNATVAGLSGSGSSYTFNLIPSGQGLVSVTLNAGQVSDLALNGNTASNTLSRTFDSVAPGIAISAPAANAYFNSTNIVLSGSCESGLPVNVSGSGISTTGTTPCSSGAFSTSVTLTSGDGIKNMSISQTDAATNTATASVAVNLDTVAPALTFTSAAIQNRNTSTNTVTFSGACETGLSVVVGGGVDTGTVSCASGAWSYTTSSQTSDATRSYTFKQTDLAGNVTTITGSWVRDTVAPALTLTSPAANFSAQTGVTLTGACESGLNVAFSGSGLLSTITIACSSGSYSQLVYFSSGDGAKAVIVNQTDLAGNSTTINRSFVRDTTPPAITQTAHSSPYSTNTTTATFGGVCEYSSTNPIAIVVSGADSTSITCSSASTWSYTTASQSTEASRTYTFSQTDAAGNVGTISAVWIRDVRPPALTITSSSSYLTSSNTVTFSGACESGLAVVVSGSDSTSSACSGGSWSYATSSSTDGTYNYTFTQTDAAGNATSQSGTWQRSTSGPVITITQSSPQITNGSSLTISGTCSGGTAGSSGTISITGSATGSMTCSSTNSTVGSWSYPVTKSTDGTYSYTFTTTDNFTTPRSSSASLTWQRDATLPVITSGSFTINGGTNTTTAVSYNPVNFAATDNLTTITKFCLKSTSTQPLASDGCWYPVNGSATNVTPSNSVSIANYSYNIGITPQSYNEYLWVMDGAGNISANAAASGTDFGAITLQPIAPPSVSTVLVSNSDTMNGVASERIIAGGSDVYIRWTASGSSLGSAPVSLFFTTDDSTYTQIASGLTNDVNNCSSVQGAGSASTTSTGCYKWTSGSPSSSYYRVRVSVTNSVGSTTFASSLPVNVASFQILAGNTETGLNGAGTSAIFQNDLTSGNPDNTSFVVSSNGTIYFRDIVNGLVYINPVDGKVRQLIPLGASTSGYGDGGSVVNAKLRMPSALALDYKGGLLVFDYDRIRRIDLTVSPPTIMTLVGGGSTTTDTVATATSLQISGYNAFTGFTVGSAGNQMRALPNGDILFIADNYTVTSYKRVRRYIASSGQVISIKPVSSASLAYTGGYTIADVTACGVVHFDIDFNVANSTINYMGIQSASPSGTGCDTVSPGGYPAYQIDPSSGSTTAVYPSMYNGVSDSTNQGSMPMEALDGHIYRLDSAHGLIRKFDTSTKTWTSVVGYGTVGLCADGTAALSCKIAPKSGFVDASGAIYFSERGRIRTITGGNVVTIAGQAMLYGDGGLASNARFGQVLSVKQKQSDGSFVTWDQLNSTFRGFTRQGNLTVIAGNGSNSLPNTTSPANTQSFSAGAYGFTMDSSDAIYYGTNSRIYKLPSAANSAWTLLAGTGGTAYYSSTANGIAASSIGFTGNPLVYGSNGSSILYVNDYYSSAYPGYINGVFGEISASTSVHTIDASGSNTSNGTWICSDSVSLSACWIGPISIADMGWNTSTSADWDTVNQKWIVMDTDSLSLRTFSSSSSTMQTMTKLANPAKSFAFKTFGSTRYLYYCNANTGKIILRNVDAGTETNLAWPISSVACTGKSLVYDSNAHSLIFPYVQNGLYGIGELLGVDPQ